MTDSPTTAKLYIDAQSTDWQPALRKIRTACRKHLVGFTESMSEGMPSYRRGDDVEVSFALQTHFLAFYVLNTTVFDSHRPDLHGLSLGKGCIRYRTPGQIDWEVVASLLEATAASASQKP
jgi:uncharacterized protein DUF1801